MAKLDGQNVECAPSDFCLKIFVIFLDYNNKKLPSSKQSNWFLPASTYNIPLDRLELIEWHLDLPAFEDKVWIGVE